FAHTILRQLYFAAFMRPYWAAVANGGDETLAGIAAKAEKEVAYHIRHAGEWAIRLGDGTEESARRMADAVEELEPYVAELFETDETAAAMAEAGVAPDPATLRPEFDKIVDEVFREGLLTKPDTVFPLSGGREGRHGEALGHLLAVMQSVHRAHPGAVW
ncbi:MAG: 1,2-phenylacetyl-CoA epoxidase subunit PaaC, partial [Pseudomonadota bacterium]